MAKVAKILGKRKIDDSSEDIEEELAAQLQRLTIDDVACDAEAEARRHRKCVLFLIDFNGTLVFRDKTMEVRRSPLPSYRQGTGRNIHSYYIRPGAVALIARLVQDPRCAVGIYTSIMRHNMVQFVHEFDRVQTQQRIEPFEVDDGASTVCSPSSLLSKMGTVDETRAWLFDREYNAFDRQSKNNFDTIRDLKLVWGHREVRSAGFDATNTVLVEAEARKARNWLPNTVLPPTFTAAQASSGQDDGVLKQLGDMIEQVCRCAQRDGADVRKTLTTVAPRGWHGPSSK